jgi:type IV pilus assembly protein PilC
VRFAYQGFDKSGAPTHGVVEASDQNEAAESLRRRGIFTTKMAEEKGGHSHIAGPTRKRTRAFGFGKRLESVASFTRQLALLVSTGTPGDFKRVLNDLLTTVQEGGQLSDAMAQHPDYFDAVCRSLICAGEQGGKLEVMLERLAKLIRQQAKVRKTIRGAMVYPILLSFIAVVVVTALLGFVLPRFEGLFKTLDTPLPVTTQWLMAASNALRAYWWAALAGIAAVIFGMKMWLNSQSGRLAWDKFVVRAPQIGRANRSFATARIARMLGTLLDGKVALLDALDLTRQSMRNSLYIALLSRAQEAVTRGENVSAAFSDPTLINASVSDALKSAERTGRMSTVLCSLADHMDEDNEVLVRTLTGLMEPVILIVMGLVVGLVAISMFLPLFDLTAAASGGGA